MRLPNPDRAIVDIAKLRAYSLDLSHPHGGHKARVFRAALGLTTADAPWLQARLLEVIGWKLQRLEKLSSANAT